MGLPVFGPTVVTGDEDAQPDIIVRVALALSRQQVAMALAVSFTELNPDRDPAALTVDEIRGEVEGYLAAAGIVTVDEALETEQGRTYPPHQQAIVSALAAAVDRAYPPLPPLATVAAAGTVTVQTTDHGPVTLSCPAWCTGQYHQQGGARVDITHTGPDEEILAPAPGGDAVLIRAALESQPFTLSPRADQVLMAVEIDGESIAFAPSDLERLADGLESAAPKVRQLAAELASVRGAGR
ncbi:hypothetical protein [Streptomyces sp. NPDC005283]|uniref:DUF6907 domain-containing protein n=1 Tax=Streptomyces sp. NPDC005283 TaxID=3156871 RepID=UPI0034560851